MFTRAIIAVAFNSFVSYMFAWQTLSFKNYFGILSGQEALEYYAEIHTSYYNAILHTIGIPFASFYLYSIVPQLFCLPKSEGNNLITSINIAYHLMYLWEFGIVGTIRTMCLYILPLHFFLQEPRYSKNALLKFALIMGFIEIIGHTFLEEKQSRTEGVLNAILYSHYFNANHFFYNIK